MKKECFTWNLVEAKVELRKFAAQKLKRVLEGGRPLNLVNKEVLRDRELSPVTTKLKRHCFNKFFLKIRS